MGDKKRSWGKPLVLLLLGLAAIVAIALLPLREHLADLLGWLDGLGWVGAVVFVVSYILACLFMIPGSMLTLGAGFVYGPLWGTILVSLGSTLGATAAFLNGRFWAGEMVASKLEERPKFAAIERAIERDAFKTVLLTRLSPLFPFNLLNYAYGLTRVSWWRYMLGSWLGMLPGTVMYVYLGSVAEDLARIAAGEVPGGGWKTQALVGVGLVATIVVATMIARKARKEFEEMTQDSTTPQETAGPAEN